MKTPKRRCQYCFTVLPAGRADMLFCSNAHRVAHDRRAGRAGDRFSKGVQMVFNAADAATALGRELRRDFVPLLLMGADYDIPNSDDDLRRMLSQFRKEVRFVLNYLDYAAEDFVDRELSQEADDELNRLLNEAGIDDSTTDDTDIFLPS